MCVDTKARAYRKPPDRRLTKKAKKAVLSNKPMSRRAAIFLSLLASACSDRAPSIISTALVENTRDDSSPYLVVAVIEDDREVERANVVLTATRSGADRVDLQVPMEPGDAASFTAAIPPLPLGTAVRWHVVATDDAGQETIEASSHVFHVGNVPSRPELLTLWPNAGPSSGGTEVLIVGRDVREGAFFTFGDVITREVTIESRTQARVKAPPHMPGLVDVTIQNADGSIAKLIEAFTYFPAPEIFEVRPASGPATGGTQVEIIGLHFPGGASFLFAGTPASNVVVVSENLARATTPSGPAGFVTVRVEHPEKGFGEKERAYEYIPPPLVEEVIPPRGSDLGNTPVRIIGQFFQRGATVRFGDVPLRDVLFVSDRELQALTLPHRVGFADVTVENPDEQRGTLEDGFFFFGPPIVDEVVPPYASSSGGATVQIRGENFEPRSMVEVEIDGIFQIVACTFLDETAISCVLPPSTPGPAGVRVTNTDGRFDQLLEALDFFEIVTVLPDRGPSSGGTTVDVIGRFLPPNTIVRAGALEASCTWISAEHIRCVTPPGPPDQFVDVTAIPSDPGQTAAALVDGYFYIAPPEITSIDPDRGPMHGGTVITIRGRFFQNGATVTIGGAACTNVVFVSATELRCTVPSGSAGVQLVVMTNPDGQSGDFLGFEYVPVTFTPFWALVDGFATITIRGTEFTANARVRIGSNLVTDLVFVSDEELRGQVPASADRGNFELRVEIPGKPNDVSLDRFSYRVYVDGSRSSMAGDGETSDVMIHDLDNDGDSDFVYLNGGVGNPGDPEVMENQNLIFTSHVFSVTDVANEGNACDYNEDGLIDIVWGSSANNVRVMHNDGNMSFTPITPPTSPDQSFETSFHDITGDGLCDLISLGISQPDTVFRNDSGTFRVIQNSLPDDPDFIHDHKLDVGDLDGDGDGDMVVVVDDVNFGAMTQRNRIYLNDGFGVFQEDTVNRPLMESIHGDIYDVRIGDIDLDGDNDFILPNYHRPPAVLINDGSGVFTSVTDRVDVTEHGDSAMMLHDVEDDGDLDLYLVSLDGQNGGETSRLFLNDGRGFYFRAERGEPPTTPSAYRGAMGDIDGDGATDILLGVVFGSNVMYFAVE
jgi:hypothetical protein